MLNSIINKIAKKRERERDEEWTATTATRSGSASEAKSGKNRLVAGFSDEATGKTNKTLDDGQRRTHTHRVEERRERRR